MGIRSLERYRSHEKGALNKLNETGYDLKKSKERVGQLLPVIKDARGVANQIVLYSWVMVATSLVLWPVAETGLFYPIVALILGAGFLVEAHLMWLRARNSDELSMVKPMRLFHLSNLYLSLLFVAVALDPLLSR